MLSRVLPIRRRGVITPAALTCVMGLFMSGAAPPTMSIGRVTHLADQVSQVACSGGVTIITPCGTSADTLGASATGERTFSVENNSTASHTYTPSCSVTTPLASCTVTPSVLVVPADSSAAVSVRYVASGTVAAAARGTVTIAVDGGAPDQVATVIAVGTVATATAP